MPRSRSWRELAACPTCGVPERAQCVTRNRWPTVPPKLKAIAHSGRPWLPPTAHREPLPPPFGVRLRPCGACRALVYSCKHWPARVRAASACCGKPYCPEVTR